MTIATFCREQLLASGPLPLDHLVARAVDAGVTRAKDPHASVLAVIRHREIELLDGHWVTPLWLLEGRCLTSSERPTSRTWWAGPDPDLELLAAELPAPSPTTLGTDLDPSRCYCVTVNDGEVQLSIIPTPDCGTREVAALAARIAALTPTPGYGEERRTGLRAVAQLMVDDPSTFRLPLPPLSLWVPGLVEDARRRAEEEDQMLEWHREDELRRRREVVLDDCTAIEVELAAARTGSSVREWISTAIDRALDEERRRGAASDAVVITLGDRWR